MKAAVLPSLGIGDALLMMIASHQLHLSGYSVITFHNDLLELAPWFPNHHFQSCLSEEYDLETFKQFDLVIVENDNSFRVKKLIKASREGQLNNLSIFYPTYSFNKHGPIHRLDQVFNPFLSMADNISLSTGLLLGKERPSKANGITPFPSSLQHRSFSRRVAIHPTSSTTSKNWSSYKFLNLAARLKDQGLDPYFCISPREMQDWKEAIESGYNFPYFSSLSMLAAFIFESGYHIGNDSMLGHLASNLNIPNLIIANDKRRMDLWRPGWRYGFIVLPPQWLPQFRPFRWKKDHWQHLISVKKVLTYFNHLVDHCG